MMASNDEIAGADVALPFFAYGTLLPGQPNYAMWGESVTSCLPANFSNGRLYDMGAYPMLVERDGGQVRGQLIAIAAERYPEVLTRIDALEGFDPERPKESAYRRVRRDVRLNDGRSLLSWVYVGQEPMVTEAREIPGGDWAVYSATGMVDVEAWWREINTVSGLHKTDQ